MKKRVLSVLFMLSLCSFMLVGCDSSTPTSEPDTIVETIAATPEIMPTPESEPETIEETNEVEVDQAETVETIETDTNIATEETKIEESPAYTFTDVAAIKYAKSNVNVRNLPNKMGDKLGGLSQNEEIHITGKCNETGWYRFEYKGDVAYVSNEYIVDEKVVAASLAETPSNGGGNNSGGSNNNSGGITWGDGERTYANAKSYFASIGYPICTVFWNGDGTFSFYFLSGQANANGDNVYDDYDMCAANGIHGYTGTGPGKHIGNWTINGGIYELSYITATPNSLD